MARLANSAPPPVPVKPPEVSTPRPQTETFQPLNKEPERVVTQKDPPPPASKPRVVEPPVMTLEEWEDEAISKIMLVTLDVFLMDILPSLIH